MSTRLPLLYKDERELGKDPLRQTQLVELHLLKVFDKLCKDNGLRYWLAYGTLLGAARHQGFIPWDDDLDVWILRQDYEKLVKILPEQLPKDVYFEDESYLRKENGVPRFKDCYSTAIQDNQYKHLSVFDCNGIYMDIFVLDEANCHSVLAKWLSVKVKRAKIHWRHNNYGPITIYNLLKKYVWYWCASSFQCAWNIIQLVLRSKPHYVVNWCGSLHEWFDRKHFDDRAIELQFENEKFPVPANYDELLTSYYGDWRKMPEEDSRVPYFKCKLPFESGVHPWGRKYPNKVS